MKCVKCGHETGRAKVNFCPNCGTPIKKPAKRSPLTTVVVLVALLILALYMAGIVKL